MNARVKSALGWVVTSVLSAAVAAALVAGYGYLAYGSVSVLPALARGQVVMAEPATLSVGTLQPGRRYKVAFDLTNLTSEPVVVNGMQAGCTCVSVDELPLEIPPRGRRPLRLWVSPREDQAGQPFSETVNLYLSVPGARTTISVMGKVSMTAISS